MAKGSKNILIVGILVVIGLLLVITMGRGYLGSLTANDSPGTNQFPVADFFYSPLDPDTATEVSFDGSTSYDPDGTISSYFWVFGDGFGANGVSAVHTYNASGTYIAKLTVVDNNGASSSFSMNIAVSAVGDQITPPEANQPPSAGFTMNTSVPYVNQQVKFDGSPSNDTDGTIVSYDWTFGDGGTASGIIATHAYAVAGTYTVTLTVTDDGGATATATNWVTVKNLPAGNNLPVPSFTFSPANPKVSQTITFNGSKSYDPDGTIASYFWTFGDGKNASGKVVSKSYTKAGNYTVTLKVTDNKGASSSTSKVVKVTANQKPVASFTFSPASPKRYQTITFNGSKSYDPDGTIASYSWKFDDGTTKLGKVVTKAYTIAKTYNVVLTVKDNLGAAGTQTKPVTVSYTSVTYVK